MLTKFLRAFAMPVAIVGALALPAPALGGSDRHGDDSGTFAERIAGSYLIDHDSDGLRDVLTIGADGTFLFTSSSQGEFDYGDSQGAWKRAGRRSIAAKALNFDYDDHAVAVVRFTVTFDRRHGRVSGDFSGALYPETMADPLHPDEPPLLTFADGFTGRRITPD